MAVMKCRILKNPGTSGSCARCSASHLQQRTVRCLAGTQLEQTPSLGSFLFFWSRTQRWIEFRFTKWAQIDTAIADPSSVGRKLK